MIRALLLLCLVSGTLAADRIGLCIMATGRYDAFVAPLVASARDFFCTRHEVTYFVFTDGVVPDAPDVVRVEQKRLGWPEDTMMRFEVYAAHADLLSQMDYLYACDADMLFVGGVCDEILGDFVVTQHPGFGPMSAMPARQFEYEKNPLSKAYVGPGEGVHYVAGGFYGGRSKRFFQVCQELSQRIRADLQAGIVAVWHDESHLNRYCIDHAPSIVLSSSYCYTEGDVLPYPRKLIALWKPHTAFRSSGVAPSLETRATPVEFVFVIPSFNNEQLGVRCIASCALQKYPHWKLYYIDDASTDRTAELVALYIRDHHLEDKCTLIRHHKRVRALEGLYDVIHACDPHKVIVLVDGDDCLEDDRVLETLAAVYQDDKVWLTYGNGRLEGSGIVPCYEYPAHTVKQRSFREHTWLAAHLRTFYAKLFQLVAREDLQFKTRFFPMRYDMAVMFPMLEMAAPTHIRFMQPILYVSNLKNPLNDHRMDAKFQRGLENHIRALRRSPQLERLF